MVGSSEVHAGKPLPDLQPGSGTAVSSNVSKLLSLFFCTISSYKPQEALEMAIGMLPEIPDEELVNILIYIISSVPEEVILEHMHHKCLFFFFFLILPDSMK